MKAIILGKSRDFGSLTVEEIPVPTCGAGEILIRVLAASINAADYRSIQMGIVPRKRIFGADVAGKVVEVGAGVDGMRVGDEVVADLAGFGFGGFAEFVAADVQAFVPKPPALSFTDAAAIPLAAMTALEALLWSGFDLTGKDVLIWGASGGVGTFTVQLAKLFGARVIAVGGAANLPTALDLGADAVFDYKKPDRPSDGKADLIVAIHGNQSLGFYRRYLKSNGRCVVVGGSLRQIFGAMATAAVRSFGLQKFGVLSFKANRDRLSSLLDWAAQGKIRPVIAEVVGLNDVPAKLLYASGGHASGKIVMRNAAEKTQA